MCPYFLIIPIIPDPCRKFSKEHLLIETDNYHRNNDEHYRFYAFRDLAHLQHSLEINNAMAEDRR